jgi:outer membrane protein assembly factor BamE (lipoprotein component of BamABCDE complex)
MLLPNQTTKQQVVQQLGTPNLRRLEEGVEKWIYYQKHQSFMAKLPWAGNHVGTEEYEVVTITFTGTEVRACVFRAMDREEFQALGIESKERPDAEQL